MNGIRGVRKIEDKVELEVAKASIIREKEIIIPLKVFEKAPQKQHECILWQRQGK